MTDPIYQKLKADAEVMLIDLWRKLSHQAPVDEWQQPRVLAGSDQPPAETESIRARNDSSGLCYFHLN